MSAQVFSFNIHSAVKCIVDYLPELASRSAFSTTLRSEELAAHELQRLLNELASLFATPKYTFAVMRFCRPILLDLACRIADGKCGEFTIDLHEQTAVAFSRSLPHVPNLLGIVLDYFRRSPSIFERFERPSLQDPQECLAICESVIRFLRFRPLEFLSLWNWGVLLTLIAHTNPQLRRQVQRCVALFVGISNNASAAALAEQAAEEAADIIATESAGRSDALEEAVLFSDLPLGIHPGVYVNICHLSEGLVDVCGVLLRKCRREMRTKNSEITGRFTFTPTAEANMRALALAVCQAKPILLQGLTGAGKTALIEHLAYITTNLDLIKIHVSDQADAKSLLGSYVCTETPGEFRWQAGALTQAVMEGRWVLIEDIDLAPTDALSVLRPVLETRKLFIPERGEEIYAASTFQLFATQRLTGSGTTSGRFQASHMLSNFWTKLVVEPLSSVELTTVLRGQFPDLGTFTSRFIDTFDTLRKGSYNKAAGAPAPVDSTAPTSDAPILTITPIPVPSTAIAVTPGRFLSARDLFKWCRRVVSICKPPTNAKILSLPVRESIFAEAVDCFCAMIGKAKLRADIAQVIGSCWEITPERVEQHLSLNKPQLKAQHSVLTCGRVSLPMIPRGPTMSSEQRSMSFAETRHSLVLLERIAASVHLDEPVLLIGETGTGKTTVIQYLAEQLGQKLVVLNLSQQSDTSDLLGGFKPVELRLLCTPLKVKFERLFSRSFSKKENLQFLQQLQEAFGKQQWRRLLQLMKQGVKVVEKKFLTITQAKDSDERGSGKDVRPAPEETRKPKKQMSPELREQWRQVQAEVHKLDAQHDQLKNSFAFSFVEGSLVKAVHQGLWILLDEINLAPAETLESLSGLLEGGSLRLTERGDIDTLSRHPNFRLFACMNPPTDAGKKDLPPGLRSRFSEFFVDELSGKDDLQLLVGAYLKSVSAAPPVVDIVNFYLGARQAAASTLLDGANQKPHYSLRTLTRALDYTRTTARDYGFQRALYEGFSMSFLTQLNNASLAKMEAMIHKAFGGTGSLKQFLRLPKAPGPDWLVFESFWLQNGGEKPAEMPHYILTESIKRHLNNLGRIVVSRKHPVLLQGPTSAGKTSMVEYLARRTGHRFVRINNHEHTDLQEYLGTYQSNTEGKLVFEEGVLVQAVRNGHWIVLDELNLAPSEVLEALNRLLDDNRELFIPETQETVKPHPHFMLFATQNPPGLYGGRKVLSRAFRNRFVELHIDDIPESEVETILEKRCSLPPSYCKKLVAVMVELQRQRQSSKVFAGKHGFVTLRDLFRWAQRNPSGYQELANEGYMLLAERLRRDDEKLLIKEKLEQHLKVKIDVDALYSQDKIPAELCGKETVWTATMRRMFVLLGRCLDNKEPALLVGETGCGKTSVCLLYAQLRMQKMHTLNCHQNTETADLLGGLRPIRGREQLVTQYRAFTAELLASLGAEGAAIAARLHLLSVSNAQKLLEKELAALTLTPAASESSQKCAAAYAQCSAFFSWHDGPLVEAMRQGDLFLIDEISLAEDSVLERLNSVLEPSRMLTLAEKGGSVVEELVANEVFRVMATMNPGGDFGKKELSPAMRSRFTEIWVPAVTDRTDLIQIIKQRLIQATPPLATEISSALAEAMLDFVEWFKALKDLRRAITLRDILAWLDFVISSGQNGRHFEAFVHGACMVLLDGLAMALPGHSPTSVAGIRTQCIERLLSALPHNTRAALTTQLEDGDFRASEASDDGKHFGMAPFFVQRGPAPTPKLHYSLAAPTTRRNLMRLLRALQLPKPILLEGSPGVGKTSLVTALAAATGHPVVRINLSEQTDMMDLLGSDLPKEGGQGGEFEWRDGAFLQALKAGHWVLLDELNLASQSVLEGLNACLDHRAEVYIPELNKTVHCPPSFRIFGCQNPLAQGGGRKGLPKSFLNRFTQVHVQELAASDLRTIAVSMFPHLDASMLGKMIDFNAMLHREVMLEGRYGRRGAPWEFNLRDVLRWCELITACGGKPSDHLATIYLHRMRAAEDRTAIVAAYERVFGETVQMPAHRPMHVSGSWLQVGDAFLARSRDPLPPPQAGEGALLPLTSSHATLEALMRCVEMNWMAILVGPTASGKTSLVRLLARLAGHTLAEFSMNNNVDTMELLGGFEQLDIGRHRRRLLARIGKLVSFLLARAVASLDVSLATSARDLQGSWSLLGSRDAFVRSNGAQVGAFDAQLLTQVLNHAQVLLARLQSGADLAAAQVARPEELFASVRALQELEAAPAQGRFEWIDGMLIKALQEGHWLVIDNVNYCEPSVLDRLNPLLEPNGVLVVSERGVLDGAVQVIKPHPSFRLFLTMDPKNGELSRALRNRGVELFMPEISQTRDVVASLSASGIAGAELPALMLVFHERAVLLRGPNADQITIRDLIYWGSLVREEIQRGARLIGALKSSAAQVYLRSRTQADQSDAFNSAFDAVFASFKEGAPDTALVPAASVWPTHSSLGDVVLDAFAATVRKQCAVPTTFLLRHRNAALQRALEANRVGDLRADTDAALALSAQQLRQLHFNKPLIASAEIAALRPADELLTVAIQAVIESASSADLHTRMTWVRSLVPEPFSPHFMKVLTNAFARFAVHATLTVGNELRSAAAAKMRLDIGMLLSQPLNVLLNAPLVRRLRIEAVKCNAGAELDQWLDWACRLPLALVHIFQVAGESEVIAAESQPIAPKQRGPQTLMQRSHALHTSAAGGNTKSRAHTNRPEDQEVAELAQPFLLALDDFITSVLAHKALVGAVVLAQMQDLLEQRNALCRALAVTTLDSSVFVFAWRLVGRTLHALFVSPIRPLISQHLQNVAEKMHAFAERLGGRGSTRLWRRAGHAVVYRRESTRVVAERFTTLARSLELGTKLTDHTHPFWLLDSTLTRTLLQAVCTLHWIDEGETEGARAEVLSSIARVAGVFESHFQKWEAPDAAQRGDFESSEAALHPLYDLRSVRCEAALLAQLVDSLVSGADLSPFRAPLQRFVDAAVSHGARSPLDAAPYQRLVWRLERGDVNIEGNAAHPAVVTQEGLRNWQRRLWSGTFNSGVERIVGSAHLTRDSESVLCFALVADWPRTPLRSLPAKRLQLKQLAQLVSLPALAAAAETDWSMAVSLFTWTLRALEKCFVPDALPALTVSLHALRSHIHMPLAPAVLADVVQKAEAALNAQALSDPTLRAVAPALLRPCIACIAAVHDKATSQAMRGRLWTLLGVAQTVLLLPLFRVDPTAKYAVKRDVISVALDDAQLRLRVRKEIEADATGGNTNATIEALGTRVASLIAALAQTRELVCARPANVQLSTLAAETVQFLSGSGSSERVLALLRSIEEGNGNHRSQDEEEAWQGQAAHLVASLETKFAAYDDLVQPFVSALMHIRHGLRTAITSAVSKGKPTQRVALQLAAFPPPRAYTRDPAISSAELLTGGVLNAVQHLPKPVSAPLTARLLRGVLLRVATACTALPQLTVDAYQTLDALFSLFGESWAKDREEEKRLKAEREALWKIRGKTHEGQTDAEAETAELAALFPAYEEAYSDLLPSAEDGAPAPKQPTQSANELMRPAVGPEETALVVRLHAFVFNAAPVVAQLGQERRLPVPLSTGERLRMHESAYGTAAALLRDSGAESAEPYADLHGGHLLAISAAAERLNPSGASVQQLSVSASDALGAALLPQEEPNPYTTPMLAEAQLALPVIDAMVAHIKQLLTEWPEHPLLLQIVEVARRLAAFTTEAPLMKLMTGAELLLRHAHDWEKNAAARVSISAEIVPLTRLIIRWRRIELDSWPRLLAARRHAFVRAAEQRWFELYPLLTGEQRDLDALCLALSEFMERAAVGDYAPRLALLHSFARQLHARAQLDNGVGENIAAVVQNLAQHYGQFCAALEAEETCKRVPIEKALADHVKLARWEDINYFALRDTIDKAHRKLLKLGRDYDEVLRQAAAAILARGGSAPAAEANAGATVTVPDLTLPPVAAAPVSSLQLGAATEKVTSLVQVATRMRELCSSGLGGEHWERVAASVAAVEDISATIIERSTRLRNEKRPRQEKKLALTEMLRGLAARGVHHRLHPAPLEKALQELPPHVDAQILPGSESMALWRKADETFYRTLSRLPRARGAARLPSKDLSNREVTHSLGYAEHLHSILLNQRATLRTVAHGAAQMARLTRTLDILAEADAKPDEGSVEISKPLPPAQATRGWVLRLRRLAAHTTEAAADLALLVKALPNPPEGMLAPLSELTTAAALAAADTAEIIGRSGLPVHQFETSPAALACPADRVRIATAFGRLATAAAPLSALLNATPDAARSALAALIAAVEADCKAHEDDQRIISESHASAAPSTVSVEVAALGAACATVASDVQLVVQSLLTTAKASEPKEEEKGKQEPMTEGNVAILHAHYIRLTTSLAPASIVASLTAAFNVASNAADSKSPSDTVVMRAALMRLRPLLAQYNALSQQLLGSFIVFHKTVCKLQFVLLNTVLNLFRDGFCIEPEAEEGKGGEKFTDDVAGTGMGEGHGKRDVSDQIEDESQLQGTKGEKKEEEEQTEPERKEKDKGVEMQDDFEGQMHDVKEPGEDEEEEEEDKEDEPEKQLGETNPEEEQVVDEKLWNKEDDDTGDDGDKKEEEKLEKDAPVRSEQEKEMSAKPDDQKEGDKKKDPMADQMDEGKAEEDEEDNEKDEDKDKEGDEGEEDEVNEDGENRYEDAHRNVEPQKEEEMELPEDMKIDEPAGDDEKPGAEEDEDEDEVDDKAGEEDKKDDKGDEEGGDDKDKDNKDDEAEGEKDEDKEGEEKRVEEELSEASAAEPEDTAAAVQAPRAGEKGHGATQQAGAEEKVDDEKEDAQEEKEDEVADKGRKRAAGAAAPQPGQSGEQEADEGDVNPAQKHEQKPGDEKDKKDRARLEPNPYRSPGDALKAWREKLRLLDAEQPPAVPEEQGADGAERAFAEPDAPAEEQAMAPATEEQMQESGAPLPAQRNEETKQSKAPAQEQPKGSESGEEKKAMPNISAEVAKEMDVQPNKANVVPEPAPQSANKDYQPLTSTGTGGVKKDEDEEKEIIPEAMEQDAESTRAALEALRVEHPGEAGAELWRKFESLTADLAQELCEQLRLILEPSLATKLKGDYRSGKRINMKKVIPYIASQFKKDKIWLRRTKPHKRAYQIMVAIDDSKSMANNHSGQIACEALATIAAAMAKLEVGEVGVVKFGADVELLHPLGQPFTDEAGARVLSQFTFAQSKDDFSLLLTRLVSTLQHARSSVSQGEHLQLSFIVSDGWLVLQQHRELNKWIREAAAQGILLVFIIIDSPNKKNSILETTSIDVTGGQVSTTPYLDKFPFPYYIVLREITTLPVILADALRQWFELVQRMEEQ